MKTTGSAKPKVLVTGGTGYIGGKTALFLKRNGYRVTCLTRSGGPVGAMPTVRGDLLRPETLRMACHGMDMVCHFAGALGRGLTDDMVRSVNVQGVENMVRAAAEAGVEYFLHISSGAVVGPRDAEPADEKTVCKPYSLYERTKYQGELVALRLSKNLGLPLSVVRPTFTYGPGDPHKLLMFKLIRKGLFFYIGNGRSTNHPVYIDDLIDGVRRVLDKRPVQEVFIVGGPRPATQTEWGYTIARELGVRPPFLHLPAGLMWRLACLMEPIGSRLNISVPVTRSRVLALSRSWSMRIDKARRTLGYTPQTELSTGVARTVAWYRKAGWL